MRLAERLTPAQRRNYIATARRMQPLEELLRKAKKANRRGWKRVFAGVEGSDYVFAKDHRVRDRESFRQTFRITYCSLCSTFAKPGFPVNHSIRCSASLIDDGPYPGWAAAGVVKTIASSRVST